MKKKDDEKYETFTLSQLCVFISSRMENDDK